MQIGKITLGAVKAAKEAQSAQEISQKLSSNPFGVSFKGNVIQADVFQKTAQKASTETQEKGKLFASAVVSGINNFNEAFKSRLNSIVSFGKKVTSNVLGSIEKVANTEIKFNFEGIKNKLFPDREYSMKNLTNKPVDELRTMWSELSTPAMA